MSMFRINDGEKLCMKSFTSNNGAKRTEYKTYNLGDDGYKEIMIMCDNITEVGEKIHCQLAGNQNYIDSYIVLNIDGGVVLLSIDKESTDDIEIDEDFNINIIRRNPDNIRVKIGLEFLVELSETEIKSYEDTILPIVEKLAKEINRSRIEGFTGTHRTCWQSDKDPDFNESVLEFTV